MPISRRVLVSLGGAAVIAGGGFTAFRVMSQTTAPTATPAPQPSTTAAQPAPAAGPLSEALTSPRGLGKPDAPVSVIEFFSLTCPHCAAFAAETMPKIQSDLIDTGKLRWVFGDYPLDQVVLTASMIARALPPDRYWPFCEALFASQNRWAFARGVNSTDELAKMAALAGLSRPAFEATIDTQPLRDWILKQQDEATKMYQVDSTPTFIFNGPAQKDHRESGGRDFYSFAKLGAAAAG